MEGKGDKNPPLLLYLRIVFLATDLKRHKLKKWTRVGENVCIC